MNKPVKSHMKHLLKKLNHKSSPAKVIDMKFKLLGLKWLEEACHYSKGNDFFCNGFVEAGISAAVCAFNTATKPILRVIVNSVNFIIHKLILTKFYDHKI